MRLLRICYDYKTVCNTHFKGTSEKNVSPKFELSAQIWYNAPVKSVKNEAWSGPKATRRRGEKPMKEQNGRPLYRIGEYARNMGVTPDLLKHYEEIGILHPETAENGYRYYPFSESFRLLESMKLHGYGLTLRDIGRVLTEQTEDEVRRTMDAQVTRVEAEMTRRQLILSNYRVIKTDVDAIGPEGFSWFVTLQAPLLFLPHTEKRAFIDDPRIREVLRPWIDAMPMTRPALMLSESTLAAADWRDDFRWGLAVPASYAEAFDLPVNGAVERFDGGRCLKLVHREADAPGEPTAFERLQTLLARLGERSNGAALRVELFSAHDAAGTTVHYGCFLVPLGSGASD